MNSDDNAMNEFEKIIPQVCKKLYEQLKNILEQKLISSDDRPKFYQYMYLLKYLEEYYSNTEHTVNEDDIFADLKILFTNTFSSKRIILDDAYFEALRNAAIKNRQALETMLTF